MAKNLIKGDTIYIELGKINTLELSNISLKKGDILSLSVSDIGDYSDGYLSDLSFLIDDYPEKFGIYSNDIGEIISSFKLISTEEKKLEGRDIEYLFKYQLTINEDSNNNVFVFPSTANYVVAQKVMLTKGTDFPEWEQYQPTYKYTLKKNNKVVSSIYKGNTPITKIYKGQTVVWEKGQPDYSITLIGMIDQSISDPTKMYTGPLGKDGTPETNVVSWIRANSHRYVGTYDENQGMILKQLDDNNSELYNDGSDASVDITTKDVFMKMPTFWFRGESINNSNFKYSIYITKEYPTDDKTWVKWDGNTLIGAYKAVAENIGDNTNGDLFSRSGVTPTVNVSQINFHAKSRNRSKDYSEVVGEFPEVSRIIDTDKFSIITYEAHQVMALIYMIYYGNMNGQEVIGEGTSSYPKITGQTNIDGMNDTIDENSRSINFWGLENWWGDIYEWMDNIRTNDNSGGINILNYEGDIKRYVQTSTNNGGAITKMILGESLDMITRSTNNNSYTSYYCDAGYVRNGWGLLGYRSSFGTDESGGPFCLNIYSAPDYAANYIGSRLQYHGRVKIIE